MGEDSSAELVTSNWILTERFVTPEVAPNLVREVFTMGMLHFFPCAKRLNDSFLLFFFSVTFPLVSFFSFFFFYSDNHWFL